MNTGTTSYKLYDVHLYGLLVLSLCGIIAGAVYDELWVSALIPAVIIGGYLVLCNMKILYGVLFMGVPLSAEIAVGGGLSTDLIGEPILWLLSAITVILLIQKGIKRSLFSWISLGLIVHIIWIIFTAIHGHNIIIGLKYALAKTWYVLPLYVLPFYAMESKEDIRFLLKCFVIGTIVGAGYYFFQHLQYDLSYHARTNAGQPIWRNHVNYACTVVLNLPILWYLHKSSKHGDRWLYVLIALILVVFMYFAYARIAYISMIAAAGFYVVIRYKLTRALVLIGLASLVLSCLWLINDQRYVELAPDYETTIMQDDFQSKISATTQGTDISTMERVHRWVAGGHMIAAHPLTGVGPGNFYHTYLPYTVYSFETYVSDNPDRSGIHSHYLMTWVEQGYIGLTIWLGLLIFVLILIERVYHSTEQEQRQLVILGALLLSMILTINLVNDMIEVIKVGTLFYFTLYLIQSPLLKPHIYESET